MLYQINKRTGLPVYVNNDGLDVGTPDLFEYTMIYLTSHYRWSFNEAEAENVAEWIRRGGTLLLLTVLLAAGGGGAYYYLNFMQPQELPGPPPAPPETPGG